MKTSNWILPISLFAALLFGACSDDDSSGNNNNTPDAGQPDSGIVLERQECPGDPACPDTGDGVFYVGAAVVDITPDLKEGPSFEDVDGNAEYNKGTDTYTDSNGNNVFDAVWIAGFGSSRPAVGVHDPIEARILAMRHNQTTVVLVSADLIGFFYDHLLGLRERLSAQVASEVDLVVWSSTHNHEGPDMIGIWGRNLIESGLDAEYLAKVQQDVADGIGDALAALEPAHVAHSATAVEHEDGDMTHLFADGRDPVIINNTMNVMRFFRPGDGSTIATIVNLGTHPEVLWSDNMLITSDFPHYLRTAIEDGVPGRFEGLGGTAIYVQGTCGGLIGPGHVQPLDATGMPVTEPNTFEGAEAFGHGFAEFALSALADPEVAVVETSPTLGFRTREVFLRVDNFNYQAAYRLGILSRALHNFDPSAYIDENNTPDLLSQLVYLRIGASSMITVPGELAPEVFIGCYDGSCSGGYPIIYPNNPNPPDLTAAPTGPFLREVLAGDGSAFQWLIGLGQDEVGYILPNFDFKVDPDSPYISSPPGDHYEETNSLGPRCHDQVVEPLTELIQGN